MPKASNISSPKKTLRDYEELFQPDYTPKDLESLGVFDELYYRTKPRLASWGHWKPEWLHPEDKYGFLEWYTKYYYGRRMADDERQLKRWYGYKVRASGLLRYKPTPRSAFALRNWAINPLLQLPNIQDRDILHAKMEAYKAEIYSTIKPDRDYQYDFKLHGFNVDRIRMQYEKPFDSYMNKVSS
jgi:hypothetical protein